LPMRYNIYKTETTSATRPGEKIGQRCETFDPGKTMGKGRRGMSRGGKGVSGSREKRKRESPEERL